MGILREGLHGFFSYFIFRIKRGRIRIRYFYLQWVLHRTFVPPRDIPSGVICSLSVPEFRVAGLGKVEFPLKVVKHWGSLSAFGPERYLFWDLCMVIFW